MKTISYLRYRLPFFAGVCALIVTSHPASAAPAAYHTAVLANNPYLFYEMAETTGTTATDSSGNGNNGTYVNGPTLGAAGDSAGGTSDTAVTFNAVGGTGTSTNEYLATPSALSFGSSLGTSSCEFVFQSTATTLANIMGGENTGSVDNYEFELNSSATSTLTANTFRFYIRDDTGINIAWTFVNDNLLNGQFHHVVCTYNSTAGTTGNTVNGATVYVDGVAQTLTANAATSPATFNAFTEPIAFAADDNRQAPQRYTPCTIDEIALYTTVLTAAQVTAHYDALNNIVPVVPVNNDYWTGAVNNNWDTNKGDANWTNSLPTNVFANGDAAGFGDTAAFFSVNVAGNITPAGMTFSNSLNNYTIGSTGGFSIGGGGGLTNLGTGTVTLLNTNTFTGPIVISAGQVVIGGGGQLGGGTYAGPIALNGVLSNASSATQTWSGAITGTGTLVQNSAGTLILDGGNSYTGATIISNGTLELGDSLALQDSTLYDNAGTLVFGPGITAATFGGLLGSQNLSMTNTAATPAAVSLTVGGNNASTTYSGDLSDGGLGANFVKNGTGALNLTGSNYYTGTTTVNSGTLVLPTGAVLDCGALAGEGFVVSGGLLTNASTTTSSLTVVNTAFLETAGTVNVGEITRPNTSADILIEITGGTFTSAWYNGGRDNNYGGPTATAPVAAQTTSGFYINSTNTVSPAQVYLGQLSIANAPGANSSSSLRMDAGSLTVSNEVLVGNQATTGRWSVLQINGGNFTNLDTVNGIVISQNTVAANDSEFYLSGGNTYAQLIQFGTAGDSVSGGEGFLIINHGSLFLGSGGIEQLTPVSFSPTISLLNGTLGATASWSSTVPMILSGSSFTLQAADGAGNPWNISLGGVLSGAGSLVTSGGGVVSLSGANTYTGLTVVSNASTLSFVTGALGTGGVSFYNGSLQWGSATTTDISSAAVTFNAGGARLDVNGNAVTLANSIGNSGTGGLTVVSTALGGTLSLNAAAGNTYAGNTTNVNAALVVQNTSGSATGSGNVEVESGATLQGNGIITGNVEIQSGGTLAGGNNSVGTITTGALALDSGAIVNVEFLGVVSSEIKSTGGLTMSDGNLFNLYTAGTTVPWTQSGTYPLITFTGTAPVLDSSWTTSSATNPHIINPQQSTCLYSFFTSGSTLSLRIIGTVNSAASEWTNTLGGNWSVTNNWSPNKAPHFPGDQATLGLGGSAVTTVNLDTNESVGELTLNNANSFVVGNEGKTLTFDNTGLGVLTVVVAGTANQIQTAVALNDNVTNLTLPGTALQISGNISNSVNGSFDLTASGSGLLALSGANTYGPGAGTGPAQYGTILTGGGTLQVGNSSALGAGDVSIASSSTLQAGVSVNLANNIDIAPSATVTVDSQTHAIGLSGTLEDSGGVTKIGSGTLTLSGANTYNGSTTIDAGIVSISADDNLGSSAETPVVLNGGDLLGVPGATLNRNVNIGPATGSIGTNALLDAAAAGTFTITGIVESSGNSGTNNLVVNSESGSTGIVELEGADTFTGSTIISNGTLMVGNSAALQDSTVNLSNPNGALTFDGNQGIGTATFGALTGSSPLALTNTDAGAVTLTVGGNNASTTYTGGLNDSGLGGGLTKVGTGTFTLTGSNYYTGTTTGSAGTLEITNGGVLNVGTLAGQGYLVDGGTLTNSSSSTSDIGSAANTFLETAGTVNVGELTQNYGGTANFLFQIRGGTFSSAYFNMGRGTDGNQYPTAPTPTVPISAATTLGLYIDSTNTASPAQVYLGQLVIAGANGANSDSSVRLSAGNLTVTNEVLIGNQATTGRWTLMQVSGGNFTNLDTVNGIVISQNTVAANDSELYLSGGNTFAQLIQFGTAGDTDAGGNGFLIISTNASLYVGSGGIVQSSAAAYTATISLLGGTLGATANWSVTNAILLEGGTNTILAGDPSGNPWNIADGGNLSGAGGLVKTGPGVLTLSGTNAWTGPTTINNGALALSGDGVNTGILLNTPSVAVESPGVLDPTGVTGQTLSVGANAAQTLTGNGTVKDNVSVGASGTVAPGPATGFGTLTVTNNLTSSGAITIHIDHPAAGATNDSLTAASLAFNAGATLTVVQGTNDLVTGDTFKLFNIASGSPLYTAANLSITLPAKAPISGDAYVWNTNNLAMNGTLNLVSVTSPINQTPTNLTFSLSGNNLTINWPANQTGWRLLGQTNTLNTGLLTNASAWVTVPGSTNVNQEVIQISNTNEAFFELVYP